MELIVCPACFDTLTLTDARRAPGSDHVLDGRLHCRGCAREFAVVDGVPQLLLDAVKSEPAKDRTAQSFGYLWSRTADDATRLGTHVAKTLGVLELAPPHGLVLEGGCGDGSDTVALAVSGSTEVVPLTSATAVRAPRLPAPGSCRMRTSSAPTCAVYRSGRRSSHLSTPTAWCTMCRTRRRR